MPSEPKNPSGKKAVRERHAKENHVIRYLQAVELAINGLAVKAK